jgi:hypothetical protein
MRATSVARSTAIQDGITAPRRYVHAKVIQRSAARRITRLQAFA